MTELVLIGYWRSDQRRDLPHPSMFVDPAWDPNERDLLAAYLRGGLPVVHMMGHSPCRMCSLDTNGTSELSDGTYLWPEGLAHYVADHQVRLPRTFVQHAAGRFEALEAAASASTNGGLGTWLEMTN